MTLKQQLIFVLLNHFSLKKYWFKTFLLKFAYVLNKLYKNTIVTRTSLTKDKKKQFFIQTNFENW